MAPGGGPDAGEAVPTLEGARPVRLDLSADEEGRTLAGVAVGHVAAGGRSGGADSVVLRYQALEPLAAVEPRPVRHFARPWAVVGPFANPQRIGTEYSPALDSLYGPERDPGAASYQGMGGRTVRWQSVDAPADGYLRLNPLFEPSDWVAAYARSWLYSPDERDAVLLLGADDAHRLWVNGEPVSERQGRNIAVVDDLAVPVHLRAGWNRVLLKVADLDGGWAFQLRAADAGGVLRWAREPGN